MDRLRSGPRPAVLLLSFAIVLAAVVLSVQAGSSALWKDEAPVSADLHVQTGTLTVQVGESQNGKFSDTLALSSWSGMNLGPGERTKTSFWIKNTGTVPTDVTAALREGDTGQLASLGDLFRSTVAFADGSSAAAPKTLNPQEAVEVSIVTVVDRQEVGNEHQGASTGAVPFEVRVDAVQRP